MLLSARRARRNIARSERSKLRDLQDPSIQARAGATEVVLQTLRRRWPETCPSPLFRGSEILFSDSPEFRCASLRATLLRASGAFPVANIPLPLRCSHLRRAQLFLQMTNEGSARFGP